jgi:predicted HicB family RNase H-like nuclease
MSTLTVKLPDSLLETIRRLAKAEGVSVNQFVSSAAGEKMAAP